MENLERKGVEKHGHEPVETDRRQFNVDVAQMTIDSRQLLSDEFFEDFLVCAGTCQRLVKVVRREILLRDRHQRPNNEPTTSSIITLRYLYLLYKVQSLRRIKCLTGKTKNRPNNKQIISAAYRLLWLRIFIIVANF